MKLSVRSTSRTYYVCDSDDVKCEECPLRFKCYTMAEFLSSKGDLTDYEIRIFFMMSGIWDK